MNKRFATKVSLLQSVKGEFSVHDQLFCRLQHRGSLHGVTRKLDLDQTSTAHKHTERQMWENSLFSQASWHFTPISSKFCIICCYYVCFGLLMQISLANYSAYLHELRVRCTLWSIIRSISGWFLNSKSLLSNNVPPLNLNEFIENCINWQYTRCWSACKQCVMFLLFTLPFWCQIPWRTYRFTLTHNTELSICRNISLYEKLSTPQNLPYL